MLEGDEEEGRRSCERDCNGSKGCGEDRSDARSKREQGRKRQREGLTGRVEGLLNETTPALLGVPPRPVFNGPTSSSPMSSAPAPPPSILELGATMARTLWTLQAQFGVPLAPLRPAEATRPTVPPTLSDPQQTLPSSDSGASRRHARAASPSTSTSASLTASSSRPRLPPRALRALREPRGSEGPEEVEPSTGHPDEGMPSAQSPASAPRPGSPARDERPPSRESPEGVAEALASLRSRSASRSPAPRRSKSPLLAPDFVLPPLETIPPSALAAESAPRPNWTRFSVRELRRRLQVPPFGFHSRAPPAPSSLSSSLPPVSSSTSSSTSSSVTGDAGDTSLPRARSPIRLPPSDAGADHTAEFTPPSPPPSPVSRRMAAARRLRSTMGSTDPASRRLTSESLPRLAERGVATDPTAWAGDAASLRHTWGSRGSVPPRSRAPSESTREGGLGQSLRSSGTPSLRLRTGLRGDAHGASHVSLRMRDILATVRLSESMRPRLDAERSPTASLSVADGAQDETKEDGGEGGGRGEGGEGEKEERGGEATHFSAATHDEPGLDRDDDALGADRDRPTRPEALGPPLSATRILAQAYRGPKARWPRRRTDADVDSTRRLFLSRGEKQPSATLTRLLHHHA